MASKRVSAPSKNRNRKEKNENHFYGILSDKEILKEIKKGNIVIYPFNESQLGNASYDVTLGMFYYRENITTTPIVNPFSKSFIDKVWQGPKKAVSIKYIFDHLNTFKKFVEKRAKELNLKLPKNFIRALIEELEQFKEDEHIILLFPKEMILAHTNEFIGGRNYINTSLKTRSSWARSFIDVCRSAGWGDIGYINRWTMEITNHSLSKIIPLVVGERIAQIVFFKATTPSKSYEQKGKYQYAAELHELITSWKPEMMLPRLYIDYEKKIKNEKNI